MSETAKRILIIDIETTGFQNAGGKIVEIGIVALNLETCQIIELLDQVVKEDGLTANDRNAWIFQNSDLTVEEVRNAPRLIDIQPAIQNIIDMYPDGITAFNSAFDLNFLTSRGFYFPKVLPCIMKAATPICKLPSKNGRSNFKWPSAQQAYDHFFPEFPMVEKHRGCSDAFMEAKIAYSLYKIGAFNIN